MMRNKNLKIIFVILAVLTVVAIISVIVYLSLGGRSAPAISTETNETDSTVPTESSAPDTETDIPTTEENSENISLDTAPYESVVAARLDGASKEIINWLKEAVPLYEKEAETDSEGVEIAPRESFCPEVAFFYKDLTTGASVSYNSDRVFYTASAIKAPYVLWVLKEIEKAENEGGAEGSKFDVNSVFVYTEDKFKEGSGVIRKSDFGTEYTYLDLLRLSITHSDNVAFAEIRNIYGRAGFNAFSEDIGITNPAKSLYRANAAELAAYLEEIYKYFDSGSKYAEMLKSWMLSTNHRIMIPWAVSPTPVANKYGWDLDAYHDTAVVFDEYPYLLVVMTELDMGGRNDNTFIRELVGKINDAHTQAHMMTDN